VDHAEPPAADLLADLVVALQLLTHRSVFAVRSFLRDTSIPAGGEADYLTAPRTHRRIFGSP
jgi:hypothetical protein